MSELQKKKKIAAAALCVVQLVNNEKKRKRTKWVKNWISQRERYGHMSLIRELKHNEHDDLKNYLRMSGPVFDELLGLLFPLLKKQDTVMRQSIPPEEQLIATLRYLATGQSYESLKFSTGIASQTLGYIIPETCMALCKALQNYIKMPETKEEWKQVSLGFKNRWQMINCGGAMDGKHIRITPPPQSGALYRNYKQFYSIVLMAVVNYNYEFIYVDVGKQGRISDGGVFDATVFGRRLKNNSLNLPESNENEEGLNFVFTADDAFPLHANILKPFPQKNLTKEKRIFNYRVSRARNVVENTFGLITSVFRILHTPISIAPGKINYVVLAICYLHNFLRRTSPSYTNTAASEIDVANTNEIIPPLEERGTKNSPSNAKTNREAYMDYFNGKGKVSWQEEMLQIGKS